MSRSKLNPGAKEFKPTLDIINDLLFEEKFRLPSIIPNPDYEKKGDLHFYMRPTICFIMPMCTGKTYYSKKYNFFDIDTTRSEELEKKLKPLREKAMIDPTLWTEHNKVWFDHTIKWIEEHAGVNTSIIFLHSVDHALALNAKYIIPLKLKHSAWNTNLIERRKAEKTEEDKINFDKLTKLNWNSVKGTIYSSRQELEKAIVSIVELIFPGVDIEKIS